MKEVETVAENSNGEHYVEHDATNSPKVVFVVLVRPFVEQVPQMGLKFKVMVLYLVEKWRIF